MGQPEVSEGLAISDGVAWVRADGEVLVQDSAARVHLLAGTAAELWLELPFTGGVRALETLMQERYPDASSIAEDIREFVAELSGLGLIDLLPESPPFAVPADVAWTVDEDVIVLAHLRTGHRTALNPVASRIWELVAEGRSIAAVLQALSAQFSDMPAEADATVRGVLDELADQGFLLRLGSSSDGGRKLRLQRPTRWLVRVCLPLSRSCEGVWQPRRRSGHPESPTRHEPLMSARPAPGRSGPRRSA